MSDTHYAVIMAGGRGTRFWPLSRSRHPKQLLKIFSGKSLIQETAARLVPLFECENTLVVTGADHFQGIRRELKSLPRENFLVEPVGRNTAPCIGLAAVEIAARDPNAIMTVLPADHWISNSASFRRTLRIAARLAQKQDALVTIGIRPSYPETGYGYILKGKKYVGLTGSSIYQVKAFHEKPSAQRARRLIRSGALWNGGIFVWRAATLLKMLQRFCPSLFDGLERIEKGARGRRLGSASKRMGGLLRREYRKLASQSIDYAVLEPAGSKGLVFSVEGNFGWSDVGDWASVRRLLPRDTRGNAAIGRWIGIESDGCLVYSPRRLVALLGIRDAMIVDTPDALLVGDIKRSQEVRELVEKLNKSGYRRHTIK